MKRKYDGHTHTEYCPHSTIEDTELLVQRAIQLGFTEYSITEHAPLPPEIAAQAAGDPLCWETASMALNDVSHYFNRMQQLKHRYQADILLHIGFEVDFFSNSISWTTDFLNEYGPLTDDGILSVHFLGGTDGLYGIDYTFEEYQTGIVRPQGSFQKAQELYYKTLIASLEADLGVYKPKRLGHISLCQKFAGLFQEDTTYSEASVKLVDQLLERTAELNYQLDLNTAGYFKEAYQDSYPQPWVLEKAQQLNIPFIYGSDTHALSDVGRGYQRVLNYFNS